MISQLVGIFDLGTWQVYVIRNRHNDKGYVGITTKPPAERLAEHGEAAYPGRRRDNGVLFPFHAAIQKYGTESFDIYVLEENLALPEAQQLETLYIRKLETHATEHRKGYNASWGGEDPDWNPDDYGDESDYYKNLNIEDEDDGITNSTSISTLLTNEQLTQRSYYALAEHGIDDLTELEQYTHQEIREIPGVGSATFKNIIGIMEEYSVKSADGVSDLSLDANDSIKGNMNVESHSEGSLITLDALESRGLITKYISDILKANSIYDLQELSRHSSREMRSLWLVKSNFNKLRFVLHEHDLCFKDEKNNLSINNYLFNIVLFGLIIVAFIYFIEIRSIVSGFFDFFQ